MFPIIRKIVFLYCCIIGLAACSHHRQKHAEVVPATDVASFVQQLDTLMSRDNDTQTSVQTRVLYANADPAIHNAVFLRVIRVTNKILIYNTGADTALPGFYKALTNDNSLTEENRSVAALKMANYYAYIVTDADSADHYLDVAQKFSGIQNDSVRSTFCSLSAQVYQLRGRPADAAASLYKSIALDEKIKDSAGAAACYGNLANVYRGMGDYTGSVIYRKKAYLYFSTHHDDAGTAVATQGLSADYMQLGRHDSARRYFTITETLFAKGVQNPIAEYYLYLSIGGMYINLEKYDSSLLYFDKAKAILPLMNDSMQDMVFTIMSTIAYSNVKDVHEEAIKIEQYIPRLLADSNLEEARDAYYSLYNIALKQKLHYDALDYYQMYDSLRTVLADNRNRDVVAELESKYESQKKTLKISVQEKELQEKNAINFALILLLITMALAAGIFIARYKLLRSRKEAKIQQQFTRALLKNTEEERGRIAAELHDGIGHELIALKNSLQSDRSVTEARIDTILNDIRMISRNLYPVMLDKIGLRYSIQHLCEQLMAGGQIFVSAEIDYQKQLPPEDELQLYRIIQESLSNVVKYSDALAARITITSKPDRLLVSIVDNGKGFDVQEQLNTQPAFGLHNIIERSKVLGGKTSISSSGEGTTIHIEIPLNHAHHYHS